MGRTHASARTARRTSESEDRGPPAYGWRAAARQTRASTLRQSLSDSSAGARRSLIAFIIADFDREGPSLGVRTNVRAGRATWRRAIHAGTQGRGARDEKGPAARRSWPLLRSTFRSFPASQGRDDLHIVRQVEVRGPVVLLRVETSQAARPSSHAHARKHRSAARGRQCTLVQFREPHLPAEERPSRHQAAAWRSGPARSRSPCAPRARHGGDPRARQLCAAVAGGLRHQGSRLGALDGRRAVCGAHSHSIVAGGLLEMSSTTRLKPRTSLMMRFEMRRNSSPSR